MIILKGYNSFYEGWINYVFSGEKCDQTKDESWKLGWNTAFETGRSLCPSVLLSEIRLGHIKVEIDPAPVQQLKAEIAALVQRYESADRKVDFAMWFRTQIKRLRQLSAV
jgi:hypothetical protein